MTSVKLLVAVAGDIVNERNPAGETPLTRICTEEIFKLERRVKIFWFLVDNGAKIENIDMYRNRCRLGASCPIHRELAGSESRSMS
jgi:hypothetical protein